MKLLHHPLPTVTIVVDTMTSPCEFLSRITTSPPPLIQKMFAFTRVTTLHIMLVAKDRIQCAVVKGHCAVGHNMCLA